jgi:hypothetical protein
MIDVYYQTNAHSPFEHYFGLTGFRPQQFAVAIHTTPVAIDESHRVTTHGTLRRRAFVNDREFG